MVLIFKDIHFGGYNVIPNCNPSASFNAVAVQDSFDIIQFSPCPSKVLFHCTSIVALNPHNQREVKISISTIMK